MLEIVVEDFVVLPAKIMIRLLQMTAPRTGNAPPVLNSYVEPTAPHLSM
jgi:hypothetical protein